MKAPDHERKLHLDGTEKPGIQKTVDCYGNLRNLRSRPRQHGDLDDEFFHRIAEPNGLNLTKGEKRFRFL